MRPRNAVILFAGGNGLLESATQWLDRHQSLRQFPGAFARRFVKRNLFVAVVDTPNQVAIDGNVRLSAQYAQDMAHVIADVRDRIRRRQGLARRHQFGHDIGGEYRRPPAAARAADQRQSAPAGRHHAHRDADDRGQGIVRPDGLQRQLAAVNVPALLAHRSEGRLQVQSAKTSPAR